MVTPYFFKGFEKAAYNYDYEVRQNEQYAAKRQHEQPVSYSKAVGRGALGGAVAGAIGGALGARSGARGVGALAGAGIASALGALGGSLIPSLQRADIEESKKIMAMDPWERREYLRAEARLEEEGRRNALLISSQIQQQRRHNELVDALRNR